MVCASVLSLLLRIEIVEQDRPLLALLAPIPHHDAGAIDHFSRVAFAVQDTCLSRNRTASQPRFLTIVPLREIELKNSQKQREKKRKKEREKEKKNSHNPAHSPNIFPSGTWINGIPCSPHSATTSFLYASSSHASFSTHMCAWRRSSALEASRSPRARPSWMRASFRTPLRASRVVWRVLDWDSGC